jgi:PleD family two-component response regulator
VLALVDDLMFASRIAEALRPTGLPLRRVRTPEALIEACHETVPGLVLLDLDADRLEPLRALELLAAERESLRVPVVGFVSHVDRDRAQAAAEAGCEVLSRGSFVRELPALATRAAGG